MKSGPVLEIRHPKPTHGNFFFLDTLKDDSLINKKMHMGVIGAGTMGTGIAQLCSASGYNVHIYDINRDLVSGILSRVGTNLQKFLQKGSMDQNEADLILSRIKVEDDLQSFVDCGFVIEAVAEDLHIKRNVFRQLESIVAEDSILASNTSSLSITSIASECKVPQRVIGTHFFNPAPLMKLVEIIPGLLTSEMIITNTREIIETLHKKSVIAKDTPGFIVNRAARPFYGEALRILDEGIADHITIDWAMKEFGGFRMGPFELMDLIGNDINYRVTEIIFSEMYFDPRYKPSITQKRMVEAGLLGKKSGQGFYSYYSSNKPPVRNYQSGEEIFERILFMLINEAADMLLFNITSEEELDTAVKYGLNYPKGLMEWAYDYGVENIIEGISKLYSEYNEDRYRPSVYLRKLLQRERRVRRDFNS